MPGPDAHRKFIEALGVMAQIEGRSRISGHIMGYLILADGPRSLTQIAGDLQISKASVSTNNRELELLGMVRRVGQIGSRQDMWEIAPRPNEQMLHHLSARFRQNADTLASIAADFDAGDGAACARVQDLGRFYRLSSDFMDTWLTQISATCSAGAEQQDPST